MRVFLWHNIMQKLTPTVNITTPFAQNGDKSTIPKTHQGVGGAASWDSGFPQETFLPMTSGGVPPHGQDFNALFNVLSQHIRFLQGGGFYPFNPHFCEAVGGYSLHAIVQSDDVHNY